MKNGEIGDFGIALESELTLINKFTRRNFSAEEVYAFSVVLCDNDVDRDFERFTDASLQKLAELFVGKTGIFDHSHKAQNQCARIFSCEVKAVDGKKNRLGEQYKQLLARAYMPKSEAFNDLILQIESGIKKEVSVGCSMSKGVCSICGQPAGICQHKKGRYYRKDGARRLCYIDLCDPTDAFEWSFVAVPAQPLAGVVKAYDMQSEVAIGNITKSVVDGEVVLSLDEALQLNKMFCELQNTVDLAGEFLKSRKQQLVKTFVPEASEDAELMFMRALDRLNPEELFALYSEGERKNEKGVSQLQRKSVGAPLKNNNFFTI